MLIRQGRVLVNPRCRNLDRHLRTTLWKSEKRTEFVRKHGEHGDLVDALSYMARNVIWGRNPEPANWDVDPSTHYIPDDVPNADQLDGLREAFGVEG